MINEVKFAAHVRLNYTAYNFSKLSMLNQEGY